MAQRFENWHQPWCVIHGQDALESLPAEIARLGIDRVLLLTSRSFARDGSILGRVRALVGSSLVGEFGHCDQHSPRPTVLRAAAEARRTEATGLVTLGGGSVTDCAKGVAMALAGNLRQPGDFDAFRVRISPSANQVTPRLPADPLPIIALPTTLSAAEYTNVAGIVDPARGSKDLYSDDRLAPRAVILDPALAAGTPDRLWAATGIKTMSDAVEQLYSRFSHPVVDAVAVQGIARLARNLPRSADTDGQARLECYVGSWLSVFAVFSADVLAGVGASLRHQIGAVCGAPHAEVACVLLPHVLRFNLPAAPHAVAGLSQALGLGTAEAADPAIAADRICARVSSLIASLGLPTTLGQIGVSPDSFDLIAENALGDFTAAGNPREITSAGQLIEILAAAS
jgi:alcohol dehydrogenase class IV